MGVKGCFWRAVRDLSSDGCYIYLVMGVIEVNSAHFPSLKSTFSFFPKIFPDFRDFFVFSLKMFEWLVLKRSMGGLWGRLWRSNKGVMGVIAYRHPFVRCYNHPCTLFPAPGFNPWGITTFVPLGHPLAQKWAKNVFGYYERLKKVIDMKIWQIIGKCIEKTIIYFWIGKIVNVGRNSGATAHLSIRR